MSPVTCAVEEALTNYSGSKQTLETLGYFSDGSWFHLREFVKFHWELILTAHQNTLVNTNSVWNRLYIRIVLLDTTIFPGEISLSRLPCLFSSLARVGLFMSHHRNCPWNHRLVQSWLLKTSSKKKKKKIFQEENIGTSYSCCAPFLFC